MFTKVLKRKKEEVINIYKNKKDFHFRKLKKGGHPNYIIDEVKNDYKSIQFTSVPKRAKSSNVKLDRNINSNSKKPCYFQRRVYKRNKKEYGKVQDSYFLTDSDLMKILDYLSNKKKK